MSFNLQRPGNADGLEDFGLAVTGIFWPRGGWSSLPAL